jgi:hypothetical protein
MAGVGGVMDSRAAGGWAGAPGGRRQDPLERAVDGWVYRVWSGGTGADWNDNYLAAVEDNHHFTGRDGTQCFGELRTRDGCLSYCWASYTLRYGQPYTDRNQP